MGNIDLILKEGNTQCYRLVNADGKAWILPAENLRIALELYQPSGRKGILLKQLLPCVHRLSLVKKKLSIQTLNVDLSDEVMAIAEDVFDAPDIEFSIFEGTPSVHQKVTIQFFSGSRILGYGKVTESAEIARLFADECRLLNHLLENNISEIPRPLYCGKLQSGLNLFIQSTIKTVESFSPSRWTNLHDEFLARMTEKTNTNLRFEDSDFYTALQNLENYLVNLPESFTYPISQAIKGVKSFYLDKDVCFSAYHADFTPWNMLIDNDRLFVFDWEYGRQTYPPMLDRYHFYIQQAIHVNHMSADAILRQMKRLPWYDRIQMNCYLLDIISRFVTREKGNVSKQLESSLEIWTRLLE